MPRGRTDLAPLAVLVTALVGLAVAHTQIFGDGVARANATIALANGHVPHIKYSLLMPLAAVPAYWFGRAIGHPLAVLARFNLGLFVLWLAAMAWLLRGRVARATLWRFVIVMAGASFLVPYLVDFNAEAFSTMLVSAGLAATLFRSRPLEQAAGAVVAAIGTANIPTLLPAVAVAALWLVVRRHELRHVAVPVLATIAIVVEATLLSGHLAFTKYDLAAEAGSRTLLPYSGLPGFSYPLFFGLISILFSFGKGLAWYVPATLLPRRVTAARAARPDGAAELTMALVVVTVVLVVVYARWWSWYGGQSFGDRFFVIAAVPASLRLAHHLGDRESPLWHDALVVAVTALAVWVAVSGLVFNVHQPALGFCALNHDQLESFCWYLPEFSFLWSPLVHHVPWTARDALVGATGVVTLAWLTWPGVTRLSGEALGATRRGRRALTASPWRL